MRRILNNLKENRMPFAFCFYFLVIKKDSDPIYTYATCGQTTAGQINLGHLGLPSVGQHWFEQPMMIPPPETFLNSSLESFLLGKFFIL
jgi:hypothetical protein